MTNLNDGERDATKEPKKPRKKAQAEADPAAYPLRVQSAWKIGAHVSAAGGVENAILNAASIGCITSSSHSLL